MDGFLARIGFGCGRLRGGVEEPNSRRLVEAALESGIRYFDTAPAYGGGASERILGKSLRGLRGEVELCTKVGLMGSPPAAGAQLRALALTALRAVLPVSALQRLKPRPQGAGQAAQKPREYGNFDVTLIRSSVARSLQELQTEYVDCLMLHEPRPTDPAPPAAQCLASLVGEGRARRLGVGTYSEMQDLPPFGEVAQFAIGPELFSTVSSRILICHGLLRGLDPEAFRRCVTAMGVLAALPALQGRIAKPPGIGALLLNAVLIGTDVQRVLVSTGSPARLRNFMATARDMFGEISGCCSDDCRVMLRDAAHQYFNSRSLPH